MLVLRVAPTLLTQERFQLDFFVDSAAWEGLFDRIEVWRSRGTASGPYQPLHYDSWFPARLPVGNEELLPPSPAISGPSAVIVGLLLQLLVDERLPVNVTFTGSNPLTYGQAATQIQAQSLGLLTAFAVGGLLVVQTVEAGLRATLRCVGGDAAPLLGLPTQGFPSLAYGRDARIELVHGQQNYSFVDPDGSPEFFYKARFYNTFSRTVSQFSTPFQGAPLVGVTTASLCRGYVNLVDVTGAPAVNSELLIQSTFDGTLVEDRAVAGSSFTVLTDSAGHAEALLVRGAKVTVAVGGTSIVRDVVVPTDPSVESINLLSSDNGTNDVFTVQIPNIPYAVRRTL